MSGAKSCIQILIAVLISATGSALIARDLIWLKSGDSIPCRIHALTDQIAEVLLERKFPYGGMDRQTIPVAQIEWIDFGFVEGEEAAFARRNEMPVETLKTWWDYHFAHLHRPRSRTASWGIAYASGLLREKSSNGLGIALAMLDRIIARAWSSEDVSAAKRMRIQALSARGDLETAAREALDFASKTGDPAPLIDVEYNQAQSNFSALKKLEEENPRWPDDDEVRPRREQLWQQTLDLFLQPHLFYPQLEMEAARGLFCAAELYLHVGEVEEARSRWSDLIALYPATSLAATSRERIAALPAADSSRSDPSISPKL